MKIVKLGNGHLKLDSEKAEEFLDRLIDEDKLWAYLSLLFNNSINDINTPKVKPDINGKSLEEMKKMMAEVMSKVDIMSKQIEEKGVAVQQPIVQANTEVAATTVETKKPTRAPRKHRSKPSKPLKGFGSLDALASKFNKADRR